MEPTTKYRLFYVLVQKLHLIMELVHRLIKSQNFLKWVEYRAWGNFDPPLDPPLVNKDKSVKKLWYVVR